MTNREPTQEQIQAFWEWCGFIHGSWQGWFELKDYGGKYIGDDLPTIDLNNMFKYAVPKLQDMGKPVCIWCYEHKGFKASIQTTDYVMRPVSESEAEDPALALFWAIWEVTHGK